MWAIGWKNHSLAKQLPDLFVDTKKVIKSYVPAKNTPAKIDILVGQFTKACEYQISQKRGRPVGVKDSVPRKKKVQEKI